MENTNNNDRGFRPIFNATITPASIETKQSAKGSDYILMQGATVETSKRSGQRTVMAFGKSAEAVRDLLVSGQAITLAVQYEGGTVRVIGLPREEAPAEAAAA
jgi:hypothetical protein